MTSMESKEFDYYLDWISDQITKLREEGGHDVDQGPSR